MNNNIQTLNAILDALMNINTKGNDTITMSSCLQTLDQTIKKMQQEEAQAAEPVEEPEVAE